MILLFFPNRRGIIVDIQQLKQKKMKITKSKTSRKPREPEAGQRVVLQ